MLGQARVPAVPRTLNEQREEYLLGRNGKPVKVEIISRKLRKRSFLVDLLFVYLSETMQHGP